MRYHEITEAPLADMSVHGSPLDQDGSYSQGDRDYMAKAIVKGIYKERMKRIPFPIYVYILNVEGLQELGSTYPEGEIIWRKVNRYGEDLSGVNEIKTLIATRTLSDPKAIHFVMGDNFSPKNQIRPTPWMIVHRMLHAMQPILFAFNDIFADDGEIIGAAMTMASVRNNMLDAVDISVEMATQYLVTGQIRIDYKKLKEQGDYHNGAFDFNRLKQSCISGIPKFIAEINSQVKAMAGKTFYI